MKIVVAPDSFKGSISAKEICTAVKKGVEQVLPQAQVNPIPLADGGEGTMENMVFSTNGKTVTIEVTGPIGKKLEASYGVLGNGKTAVIEMAEASGLPLLKDEERDPVHATTYGTGELIKHALDEGYREFIIGLGGSATNDGGAGMLRALGVSFYDQKGERLPEGGGSLINLAKIDDSNLDPRIHESKIMIASDVSNPLCGPEGASAIFGPQKGATPELVEVLDQALNHFAEVVLEQKQVDMRELEGGGAAGGLGAGLITFLNAEFKSGIQLVMEGLQFKDKIKDADLLITGEGKLDTQTLSGKVIKGVCDVAKEQNVPVIALCGGLDLEASRFDELGVMSAFTIVSGPCDLKDAMEQAPLLISERIEAVMRVIKFYQNQ